MGVGHSKLPNVTDVTITEDLKYVLSDRELIDTTNVVIDFKKTNKSYTNNFTFRMPEAYSETIEYWEIKIYENSEILKTFKIDRNFVNTEFIQKGGININDFFTNNKLVRFNINFGWYDKYLDTEKISFNVNLKFFKHEELFLILSKTSLELNTNISKINKIIL
jgi:hypothetical protein